MIGWAPLEYGPKAGKPGLNYRIELGSEVLVRLPDGWLIGRAMAMTPKVCVVEVDRIESPANAHRRRRGPAPSPKRRARAPIPLEQLSAETMAWPPTVPPGFPMSMTDRGYLARIGGTPRWICGKKSPREAYQIWRGMVEAAEDERKAAANDLAFRSHVAVGDHVAYPWEQVYAPVQPSEAFISSKVVRLVSKWAHRPTTEAPECIRGIEGLQSFSTGGRPKEPCVYFLCLAGRVTYVGQTTDLAGRLNVHREAKSFDAVFYLVCPNGTADGVERRYIRQLHPPLNRAHKRRFFPAAPAFPAPAAAASPDGGRLP